MGAQYAWGGGGDTVFSLLGAQQGRSDPGSLVLALGSSEMLSSDHTHSVDRTRHQTQSLGMTSAALAKGAAGG